jgi:hypothetical protein
MVRGDHSGASRGRERFPDADNGPCPGGAGALNDVRAVGIERRIGEMRVAIDEKTHQKARTAVMTAVLQFTMAGLPIGTLSG